MTALPGVRSIAVDPVTTRAELTWDPAEARLSELLAQLARLGYTPCPYTEDDADRLAVEERRASLKRLIVAGLGMMQVTSFAVAMYAGAFDNMEAGIREFLRLISLVVATPVVFYAGWPFFQRAWLSIRERALGMDVPVSIAIGCAYAASVWNTFVGYGEVYFDSATMFVFFLTGARYLEMMGRHRALSLTGSLARHLPGTATRLDGDSAEEVGVMELRVGDRVLVQPGKALPVDGILLSAEARLDESVLTGESTPVAKFTGGAVVAGSVNLTHAAEIRVERVGAETVMAQIGRLVTDAREQRPRLVEVADRIASWFVASVLLAATAGRRRLVTNRARSNLRDRARGARRYLSLRPGAGDAGGVHGRDRRAGAARVHDSPRRGRAVAQPGDGCRLRQDRHADAARQCGADGHACAATCRPRRRWTSPRRSKRARNIRWRRRFRRLRAPHGRATSARIRARASRAASTAVAIASARMNLPRRCTWARPGRIRSRIPARRRVIWLADDAGPVAEFDIAERIRAGARADLARLDTLDLDVAIASGDRGHVGRSAGGTARRPAFHAGRNPRTNWRSCAACRRAVARSRWSATGSTIPRYSPAPTCRSRWAAARRSRSTLRIAC